ncbi:recombinase family protein [Embleya sp. NPDC059237]|uniref:recombinase family protein n=1 Tax=Embleya sp. NPDC059237 TaxID=3346784 RepID=UPI00367BAA49
MNPCLNPHSDHQRNPHRTAEAWTLTSVHAVLSNPRYTGRRVWNRQRTDHDLVDPANTTLGHRDVMRRNTPDAWIISEKPAHPALVSEADLVTAQGIRADKSAPEHMYQRAGLLRCGHCRRRMESCWSNGRAAYRRRHGHSSATPRDPDREPNAYVREDHVLADLPALHLMRTGETSVPDPARALARLRKDGITLIYDQAGRTVTADTEKKERVAIGR